MAGKMQKGSARSKISEEAIACEEKAAAEAKRIADEKEKAKRAEAEQKEIADKNAGFIEEVTIRITNAKSISELDVLSERVYDIWANNVPVVIQELAAKRAEEIETESPFAPKIIVQSDIQKDWVKVTLEEARAAEKLGKLAGFDDKTMTAKINK